MTVAQDGDQLNSSKKPGRPRVPGMTEAILQAAIELVADVNIDEITLEMVAARAGVGRPTIYRRWPSKEALLEEAINKILDSGTDEPRSGNVRDDLINFARSHIELLQGPAKTSLLAFFNLSKAHFADEAIRTSQERTYEIVRRAVARGELRSDADPVLLVQLVFAIIWHRAILMDRHMEPSFAEKVVDAVLNSWLTPAPRDVSSQGESAGDRP